MNDALIDRARPIRAGEELDAAKLAAYLETHVDGITGPLTIEQFPGGHSNLTYLIRAGGRDLVLRRPPFGNRVKTAHDMGREHRILSKLSAGFYAPAPRPLAYCEDESVLGAPFYVMERIRGVILRHKLPEGLTLDPSTMQKLCVSFVDSLAALHAVDYEAAGLGGERGLGKPAGYIERQVSGWTKRYKDAQTDEIPAMDRMATWLAERVPGAQAHGGVVRAAVIHNDYKFDNMVLDPKDVTHVLGVLDWEMSTVGDPLMDLGTALGYWVEAADPEETRTFAFGPSLLPGCLTRRAIADLYGEKTGRDVSQINFFYCFALFKNAGVLQQIYWRYRQGLTKDERFAKFGQLVELLAQTAETAAAQGAL